DGGSDWLHWSKEVAEISANFMKTVDAILIGRKTYEVMLAFGQTSYPGAKNYVFSRSKKKAEALKKILATKKSATTKKSAAAKKVSDKDVEIITEEAAEFVKKL